MGQPAPVGLTSKEMRQWTQLQKRSDLAVILKLARPDHAWTPDARNPAYCSRCALKSPFKMDMKVHLYIVKEWP